MISIFTLTDLALFIFACAVSLFIITGAVVGSIYFLRVSKYED